MRNNCYFISRAETSSAAVGMRGGRESSQSAFCFKLQDSVQEEEEEEEGGDTHTGGERFDDAADVALLSGV